MNSRYDVVVVGGGAAGVAAAVAAARCGAEVCLIERYGFLGGMATSAEVGTVCGLYSRSQAGPHLLNDGFSAEFANLLSERCGSAPMMFGEELWFLPYQPPQFRLLCDELVKGEGIHCRFHATAFDVTSDNGAVQSISTFVWNKKEAFVADAFIDCSGEATLCTLLSHEMLPGNIRQAGAVVFEVSGLQEEDESLLFKKLAMAILRGNAEERLPQSLQRASLVPGSLRGGTVRLKLSLPEVMHLQPNELASIEMGARNSIDSLIRWLRASDGNWRNLQLTHIAPQVGVRTGQRPRGSTVLTTEDVIECRKHTENIGNAAWPIEQWFESRTPEMVYLPLEEYYTIPAGCIRSPEYTNLYFAGRNISATDQAIASARVIGTCLVTGYAAGEQASEQLKQKTRYESV